MNCIWPKWSPPFDHVLTTGTSLHLIPPPPDFEVRKVSNGFILKKGYEEFVFANVIDLNKFIAKEFGK